MRLFPLSRSPFRRPTALRAGACLNQSDMSKVRILIADDHPGVPEMVEDILESTFEVIGTVGNGKSLVESALRLQPDVIIADISMPILNGIEAAKQLRESGSRA